MLGDILRVALAFVSFRFRRQAGRSLHAKHYSLTDMGPAKHAICQFVILRGTRSSGKIFQVRRIALLSSHANFIDKALSLNHTETHEKSSPKDIWKRRFYSQYKTINRWHRPLQRSTVFRV